MVHVTQEWPLTRNTSGLLKCLGGFSGEGLHVLLGTGAVGLAVKAGLSAPVLRGGGSSLTLKQDWQVRVPVVPQLPLRLSREQKALAAPPSTC